MRLKKNVIEAALMAIATTAVTAVTAIVTPDYTENNVVSEVETEAAGVVLAGVFEDLEEAGDAVAEVASIQKADTVMVAEAAPELTEEEQLWSDRLMANVDEFLYIRSEASEEAAIEGKLYKGSAAEITETLEGWYCISSGSVEGYVKSEYCVAGQEAYELAQSVCETKAAVQVNGLRIRKEASEDAAVIKAVTQGEELVVDTEAVPAEGWVAVKVSGNTGYVSAEYVEVSLAVGEAVSLEEEQAAIKKQQEEEAARQAAKQAAQAAQTTATTTVQNTPVAASVDDATLLAAIIQCEAGNECYEGQVAVGAVVMNRVRSGSYPSTIYEVVYQRGQFTPAGNGKVASVISSGVSSSCMQAAQAALAGTDNTGGALSFRRASSGHAGTVIGNHVFY